MQNFYWGSATSSHQVEGGMQNDWSEWEQKNAERLAREAHTKWASWQREKFPEMFSPENYISGIACDHYRRYEEDFDLARDGGHNVHRFSVEWSRIEPEEGKFDEVAIEHYVNVVEALRARGLEPFVTLWHWTLPAWLSEKGGLLARDFPQIFARYAEKVARELDSVKFMMTVNEPNSVITNGYITGAWPPQKKNIFLALRAYRNLARTHCLAYAGIKKARPEVQVGVTEFLLAFVPRRARSPLDRWMVRMVWRVGNEQFLSRVSGSYDFLGVQNYTSFCVGVFGTQKEEKGAEESDLGWKLCADTLGMVLSECKKYGVPLYVTEDGLADTDDAKRCAYIVGRVASMKKAMADGADVRGYFHWSLLDNFEWDKGFWPRFGLIEVDRRTLERKPRESFGVYKRIIEASKNSL